MPRTPLTKEEVAEFIKTAADGYSTAIKDALGHGGYSWSGDYSGGMWAMCQGIADAINQELDEEDADLRAYIEEQLNLHKAKINELIAAYNQLRNDYNNNTVPTSAPSVQPL